jgi:excisionase family DNA binding protein
MSEQRPTVELPDEGEAPSVPAAPEWLSTKQAAAYLGIIPRTLYRLIDSGQLPAYRFGRVIRLQRHQIDGFIESVRIQPGTLQHLCSDATDIIDGDTADHAGDDSIAGEADDGE